MKTRTSCLFVICLLVLGALSVVPSASAHSSGIAGYSGMTGSTCASCHNGGIQPTVTLTGPTSVTSGSTNTYTLTVQGGQEYSGGLDVAATQGNFAVIEALYTKILSGELVHSQPKRVDAATRSVSWSFTWTAPTVSANTAVTLYGAGLSANGSSSSGDGTNKQALSITVAPAAPVNHAPVANAGGPYSGVAGQSVLFDGSASSDADGNALTYNWNFGDGASGTGAKPTHVYAAAGTYNVGLTVSDGSLSNSAAAVANISAAPVNQAPVASAGGPYSGTLGQAIQFDGSGSSDPDGDVLTYNWNFGDGGSATGASPTHAYAAAGTYDVTVTVSDGTLSNTAATVANVYAGATPIVLRFRVPGRVGLTAGKTADKALSVTASLTGVAPGTQACGTAFLEKNGTAYQNQPICITAGSNASVQFAVSFTAADAPSVTWTTYVVVSGTESNRVTKSTNVKVR